MLNLNLTLNLSSLDQYSLIKLSLALHIHPGVEHKTILSIT